METRSKSNAEFRNEVSEILARHESSFDQVHATLQTVLAELQALRATRNQPQVPNTDDVNPFAVGEAFQSTNRNLPITTNQTVTQIPPLLVPNSNLKLYFPKFTGEDPTGWIYRAEQYFEFQNISTHQRVQLASFHLEGIALQWHRWLTKFKGPLSWQDFTKALLHRFGPTEFNDPSEALTRLKQTSTVALYQEEFERLSQLFDNLPDTYLIGCFIAGLKKEVRLDVKIKKPRTLSEAIGVARLIEERNTILKKSTTSPRFTSSTPPKTAGLLGPPPTTSNTKSFTAVPPTFKKITGQEARERREKGLCFYCDEKYILGHRCQRPQLYMIEDIQLNEPQPQDHPDHQDEPIPEISFHAMAGTNHPQTIRVLGKMKNNDITVLIDGGSTHNFIDQNIVAKYKLHVVHDKSFQVMVANHQQVNCFGRCLALTLIVQGYEITADYFVLPEASCQAVLGVQWLETLGPIESNYKDLTMGFVKDG